MAKTYTTGWRKCKVIDIKEWPKNNHMLCIWHPDYSAKEGKTKIHLFLQTNCSRGYAGKTRMPNVIKGSTISVYFEDGVAKKWR